MVASDDLVLSDPHVSGTATACRRDILSTIGSAPHGSTAATASNLAMLSSALGIDVTAGDTLLLAATLLLQIDGVVVVGLVICDVVVVDEDDVTCIDDHRLAFAGEQFAWISPVSPHAPISYFRLVAVA